MKNKYIETPEEFMRFFLEFREWKTKQLIKVPHIAKFGVCTAANLGGI